jgi:hypothetical protein
MILGNLAEQGRGLSTQEVVVWLDSPFQSYFSYPYWRHLAEVVSPTRHVSLFQYGNTHNSRCTGFRKWPGSILGNGKVFRRNNGTHQCDVVGESAVYACSKLLSAKRFRARPVQRKCWQHDCVRDRSLQPEYSFIEDERAN